MPNSPTPANATAPASIPSVDRLLRGDAMQPLIETHGRSAATDAVRAKVEGWHLRHGSVTLFAEGTPTPGVDATRAVGEGGESAEVAVVADVAIEPVGELGVGGGGEVELAGELHGELRVGAHDAGVGGVDR